MKNGKTTHYLEAVAMTETKIENKREGTSEVIKNEDEYLPVDPVDTAPAYVGVTAGATINLLNFNMGKVSISINYPCNPNDVDEVYPRLKRWIDKRLAEEVTELRQVAQSNKVSI